MGLKGGTTSLAVLTRRPHHRSSYVLVGFQMAATSPFQISIPAEAEGIINKADELDEFDLRKYEQPNERLQDLLQKVQSSRKVVLQECNLTDKSCEALATALRNSSCLRELDLSKNDLQDAKIRLLSAVLENPCCKLEILRLEHSNVTKEGWLTLFKALRSNPSHLRELNLSNILLFSGITELCAFLGDPSCRLEKLHLEYCSIRDEGCADLINALKSNPSSHLRELNLSWNDPGKSGVKQFSDLLDDSQCKLEKLQLASCNITCGDCVTLVKALKSNPSSHLRELNLSNNLLGHSGAKELSDLLKDPLCKLEKLQLSHCKISCEDCDALDSAMKSNPSSPLTELNLSFNSQADILLMGITDQIEGLRR